MAAWVCVPVNMHVKYIYIIVHVCDYVGVPVNMHLENHGRTPGVFLYLSLPYFLETMLLTESEAHPVVYTSWPPNFQDMFVSASQCWE